MRIATPGPARSRLLLLATLVLVLGRGTVWLALGTARPLQAPPLPPATARPSATPAPASPPPPGAAAAAETNPTRSPLAGGPPPRHARATSRAGRQRPQSRRHPA